MEKIIKIIKRYPTNKRIEILNRYSKELSQTINETIDHSIRQTSLDSKRQEIIDKAYLLSTDANNIFNMARKQYSIADDIYSQRNVVTYNQQSIEALLKSSVSQLNTGKALEFLIEANYNLNVLKGIDEIYNDWIQVAQTLQIKQQDIQQYDAQIDTMVKTIREIIHNYQTNPKKISLDDLDYDCKVLTTVQLLAFIMLKGVGAPPISVPIVFLSIVIYDVFLIQTSSNRKYESLKEKYFQDYLDLKSGKVL